MSDQPTKKLQPTAQDRVSVKVLFVPKDGDITISNLADDSTLRDALAEFKPTWVVRDNVFHTKIRVVLKTKLAPIFREAVASRIRKLLTDRFAVRKVLYRTAVANAIANKTVTATGKLRVVIDTALWRTNEKGRFNIPIEEIEAEEAEEAEETK